ncbi:flagellar biosynthetic protein FliO [Aquabacter sp. L1I39]|uniref:flagellar biosynthetic protein FliO n=1 Tax=Aquabacter sp. L1I39 TaxID=2820278 RepID=UPI001FFD1898|nr:flagellar biosynthetic protein FliO [Aquabacter sp. L1I39]
MRLAIATVVIVVLLGLTVVIVRALSGRGRGPGGRSRQARLAVMDSVPVDQKRRLILVRRDDVEHLLLIGGNRDLVVEPSIPRGLQREQTQAREALPLREAGRDVLPQRETTLLRRAPVTPPLMAPNPGSAGMSDSTAASPVPTETPAAKAPPIAEPPAPAASRFAALRRPVAARTEADGPAAPAATGDAPVAMGAAASTFSAAKRVFESRKPTPKAEPRIEERTASVRPVGITPQEPVKDETHSSPVFAAKDALKDDAPPAPAPAAESAPVESAEVAAPTGGAAPAPAPEAKAEPAIAELVIPAEPVTPAPEAVASESAPRVARETLSTPEAIPLAAEGADLPPPAPRIEPAFTPEPKSSVPAHMTAPTKATPPAKAEPKFDMPAVPVAESRPVEMPAAKAELKIEDLLGDSPAAAETEEKIEPKIETKIEPTLEKADSKIEFRLEPKLDVAPTPEPAVPATETPATPPARRAPVFNFGRAVREPAARAEPKLGELSARLQTSLDKALHAPKDGDDEAPAKPKPSIEPPAPERTARPTATFPPSTFGSRPAAPPVPPFVPPPSKPAAARPASPFRAAPLPPEVVVAPSLEPDVAEEQASASSDRMDSHTVMPEAEEDTDAVSDLNTAPPVRVVEPEPQAASPISEETLALIEMEAGLNLETDLMRELELTLAQEVSGEASVAPMAGNDLVPASMPAAASLVGAEHEAFHHGGESEPPRAEPHADPEKEKAAKEAASIDPFEDLEAEMASLLGRAPRR